MDFFIFLSDRIEKHRENFKTFQILSDLIGILEFQTEKLKKNFVTQNTVMKIWKTAVILTLSFFDP